MIKERQVTMISGDILPSKLKSNLSKKELDGIKNVFSSDIRDLKKSQDIVDSGKHSEQRGRIVGKKNPQIHEDWESVKISSKLQIGNLNDTKTIIPSRGEGETAEGGRGYLRGSLASLFNPTAIEDVRNSEYTDHAIQAGKDRKTKISEKSTKNRDWEIISAAKNTKDSLPSQLGFAPLKSAFAQSPIPEVKIFEVESMKNESEKNKKIGKEAFRIREQANKEAKEEYSKKLADNRKWEDVVIESITNDQSKNITIIESNIKIAKDFVKEGSKNKNISLDGLFPVPPNPKELEKEANIKRDSSNLRSARIKREDDRSWETLNNTKSRKY